MSRLELYKKVREKSMTKAQAASALLLPEVEFDTALPQGWLDKTARGNRNWGHEETLRRYEVVRSGTVWAYRPGSILGVPYPLTAEAKGAILEGLDEETTKLHEQSWESMTKTHCKGGSRPLVQRTTLPWWRLSRRRR